MDAFQSTISQGHRRLRLAETIAWCSFKPLENSPEESEDIKHRRQLAARASAILRTTYQPDSKSWFSWLTGRKKRLLRDEAFRLLREAAPDSIEPLKDPASHTGFKARRQIRFSTNRDRAGGHRRKLMSKEVGSAARIREEYRFEGNQSGQRESIAIRPRFPPARQTYSQPPPSA